MIYFSISEEDTTEMGEAAKAYAAVVARVLGDKIPEGATPVAFRSCIAARLLTIASCEGEDAHDMEVMQGAADGLGQIIGLLPGPENRSAVAHHIVARLMNAMAATATLTDVPERLN